MKKVRKKRNLLMEEVREKLIKNDTEDENYLFLLRRLYMTGFHQTYKG